MILYLHQTSPEAFLQHAHQRNQYNYMNDNRLLLIYDFLCNKKLKSQGDRNTITINRLWMQSYSQPRKEADTTEAHTIELFNYVFCECERLAHLLTSWSDSEQAYNIVKSEYGKRFTDKFKQAQ